MKFNKVIGNIDSKLVAKAEEILSNVFLELGTRYDNEHVGSGMGGDPLLFSLLFPMEHVCTLSIRTAATDGRRYYWNPKFIIKQYGPTRSTIGLRIVCGHEAWHAIYMHPQRRGTRNPKLWNIAVDYIVNGTIMDDFKARKMDPKDTFSKYLGRYMTLDQFATLIKNPNAKIKGFEDISPDTDENEGDIVTTVKLPAPDEDRPLTAQEQKELERQEKKIKFYYADSELPDEMKRPEKIYDFLYNLLPKCPKCGRIGRYSKDQLKKQGKNKGNVNSSKPQEDQGSKQQGKGKQKNQGQNPGANNDHCHGDGEQCNCPGHQSGNDSSGGGQPTPGQGGCDECGGGYDIFGLGGTLDDHIDTSESEEKLAQRISDAIDAARKMAGVIPAALEDELGKLTAPKITWQDIIRTRLLKARAGNGRNDWTRFRSRPMFTGLLVPKRKNYFAHFGCLLDTSGSMTKEDMAFGVSQLAALDERSEGTIVPADSTIYWDKATKIKKASQEELNKIKIVGRGGTKYAEFFSDYEKNIGKCDFLIVITDGFLLEQDIVEMKHPGVDVIWLITSGSAFKAPFGRVFDLHAS
jgi:predicted metal-dependent peptidase/uncharacterized C2H2 Zn-finger protein